MKLICKYGLSDRVLFLMGDFNVCFTFDLQPLCLSVLQSSSASVSLCTPMLWRELYTVFLCVPIFPRLARCA